MRPSGLIDVIHWLEEIFARLGIRHSYGGAVAYNYYGPPRLTQDVDVLAQLPALKIPAFVEELDRLLSQYGTPSANEPLSDAP